MRQRDEQEDHDEADPAQPAGLARIAPIDERLEDGDEPPREDEPIEDQQQLERPGHDRVGEEHRRGVQLDQEPGDAEEHERRDREDGGRPAATVERLAEARQDGRQDGGEEAALVGGARVGLDAAGVHDDGFVSCGKRPFVGVVPPRVGVVPPRRV